MKWPTTLTVVRHGESAYNALKGQKEGHPLYEEFKAAYVERREDPERVRELARRLLEDGTFVLGTGDHDTHLTNKGQEQAEATGRKLKDLIGLPDVVLVSPYRRTHHTLAHMAIGWPELAEVRTVEEERLREQEHGLALLYSDWRILNVLHPEQEALRKLQGAYWYRYPQGENVPDVRERWRSLTGTMTRDYANQSVLVVGHHLSILALRANQERLDAQGFMQLDRHEKPINCGVTIYRGEPDLGQDGRLVLDVYNQQLY